MLQSPRQPQKPTRAEYLLRGASAQYQNLLLEKIKSLYDEDPNARYTSPKGFFVKPSPEMQKRKKQISNLLKEYGEVFLNDLKYNYGVDNINWKPSDYSEKDKKFINRKKNVKSEDRIKNRTLFQTAQNALMGFNYNYCGSGTPIGKFLAEGNPPSTYVDLYCMIHDIQYLTISAKGLDQEQVNTLGRKADIELKKNVENLLLKLDEKSANYKDAQTVASAMKAKIFFEGLPNSPLKPSQFIPPLQQRRNPDKLKEEAGKELIANLEYASGWPLKKDTEGIDGLFERELQKGRITKSEADDFELISDALSEMIKDEKKPTLFDFDDDRRQVRGFANKLNAENIFLNNKFGEKNKQIDEFSSIRSLTSKSISPETKRTYFAQVEPKFLRIDSEEEEEATAGRALAVEEGAGEERKEEETVEEEPEEEGERLIDPSDPVKTEPEGAVAETPVDVAGVIGQRDNVGQEERVDIKADPPMSAMAMTDAKPVVGERNMRPTLFREEGDTVELSRKQDQENRLFYENFTWIDAGFGNGNIQRVPNQNYAGGDIANNRLYTAQVKNEMLKYSGDLFVGSQQHRKKYNISANTRNLVRRPMHSTVQHHQQFIRDSSLPAGAGRKHQMARDNPSWMPSKNVNSRVGHLYYPDVVDGQRL